MSTPSRIEHFDVIFADRLNKSWNRQIIGLVLVALTYFTLLYFRPPASVTAVMIIAIGGAFYAYQRRRSYEIYDLMFADNPLDTSQGTVSGIRSGILAEMALHFAAFLMAAGVSTAG